MTTNHTTESVDRLAVDCHKASRNTRDEELERLLYDCAVALRCLHEERDHLIAAQSYTYIGKDGKPVLARDLEDERDALRARLDEVKRVIGIVYTGLEFMAADDDDAGQMASRLVRHVRAFINGGGNG